MFIEGSYNAVIGSHLQTQLLQYDQVNPSYLTAFGNIAQSTTVLNSAVGSATAIAAGIGSPYPGFSGSVRQALRPFPQYTNVDTYGGQGDQRAFQLPRRDHPGRETAFQRCHVPGLVCPKS
jgi:hypothetical protein